MKIHFSIPAKAVQIAFRRQKQLEVCISKDEIFTIACRYSIGRQILF